MPLNADHLEAFWTVVQTGGFHKASDALFITQSAVTQRIKALEAALGQRLFVRTGRGAVLTPAGQLLVRHCRVRREAEEALISALGGAEGGLVGRLAVAAGTAVGRAWVLPELAALGREHPALDASLLLEDGLDPLSVLESCQVDAVVGDVQLRRRGFVSRQLGTVAFGLVASPSLAEGWGELPTSAQLLSARAIDFHAADRITLDHLAACLPGSDWSGLKRHFVNDDAGILAWVVAGGGFSVVPLFMAASAIEAGTLLRLYPGIRSERPLYVTFAEGLVAEPVRALVSRLRSRGCPGDGN